ncbi:DUF1275 domain-containing protein [Skermania sp. ID1734]|uniref:YoaK family protein n=1 Tax=Skermania sp. ID1734 TaxID=2597516 RepID=UPI00117C7057|nr:YoaK family protein [Skermania sp. ID1734]TSD93444.1 DUF1275 domain-containing protein [Skermania sp. ID1734]
MADTSTTLRFAALVTAASGFLDSYTYVSRGHVFANAQTANVIFFGIDVSQTEWHAARQHLWPILAFIVGIAFANVLKSEPTRIHYPMRWAMVAQVAALVIVGFVPLDVPNAFVTIPVAFVAALQMGLFRTVASLSYITIATTGNLMRWTEAGYAWLFHRDSEGQRAMFVYSVIIASFISGAVVGAAATSAWSEQAAWIPAALLAATLVLFYVDDRSPHVSPFSVTNRRRAARVRRLRRQQWRQD